MPIAMLVDWPRPELSTIKKRGMHRNFAITDNDKLYIYNITDHYMLLLRQKKHDTLLLLILIYCIRYSDKATINNEPGLSAFATHVATGIGSPRENKLMVCTPKLTTMRSRRRMHKKKSMQQISQRTNSRSRKKIPMSSRSSWRPTQPNIRSTTECSERKNCSW